MNTYFDQIKLARDQVADNRIDLALKTIKAVLKEFNNSEKNSKRIISLQRRNTDIENRLNLGTLSNDEYFLQKNKIVVNFLDLTSKIINDINDTPSQSIKSANRLIIEEDTIIQFIEDHIALIRSWGNEISFKDLREAKSINDVYIEVDISLTPRRLHVEKQFTREATYKIQDLIPKYENIAILGDPGAGKTTTLKFIFFNYFFNNQKHAKPLKYKFAILIRLRELSEEEFLYDRIASILGIFSPIAKILGVKDSFKEASRDNLNLIKKIVHYHLDYFKILLLLDGLDELNQFKQKIITDEINDLLKSLVTSNIILTCRSGAYNFYLEKINTYELCDLTELQVEQFAKKWLKNDTDIEIFLSQLSQSPFKDTSFRPLFMAHLCALFERYKRIPDKPKSVYKKIIFLLLEEWDAQRGITRGSKYSMFDIDRKMDFLSNLSYELTIRFESKVYSKRNFKEIYYEIYQNYGLLKDEVNNVFQEVEAHNGIIVQSSFDTFEFSHKSLQEYLSAEYIVRLANIPLKDILDKNIYNELAIATCLASNSSQYFCYLVFDVFNNISRVQLGQHSHINEFLTRLYQENPDFYISDSIAIAFITLYNKFYLNNASTITDCYVAFKHENYFHEIFNKFLKNRSFRSSVNELSNKLLISEYNYSEYTFEETTFLEIEIPKISLNNYYFQNTPNLIFVEKDWVM